MSAANIVIRHPDFDFVLDGLNDVICTSILQFIARSSNSKLQSKKVSTVREKIKGLTVYAEFLRTTPPCRVVPLIKNSKAVTHNGIDWLTHTVLFESYLTNNVTSVYQRNKHRSGMKYWWSQLSTEKFCPPNLKLKLEDVKRVKNIKPVGRKTVFDNDIDLTALPKEVIEFIDSLGQKIDDAAREKEEILSVYTHVAKELHEQGEIDLSSIKSDQLPSFVQTALQNRLDSIRNHAEKRFANALAVRRLGRAKARNGRKHLRLIKNFLEVTVGSGYKNPFRDDVSKLSNDEFTNAILAYLLFVDSPNRGIGFREKFTVVSLYQRFHKEQKRRGISLVADVQQDYIGANKELLISAQIILIHELAANPSSVQNIEVNADYTSFKDIAGIEWYKPRAEHKILTILDSIEQEVWTSPTEVVRIVRHATRYYRKHCVPADKHNLFLNNYQNATRAKGRAEIAPCSTPRQPFFYDGTLEMLSKISGGIWTCNPLQLRNSILLLEGLSAGVDAAKIKAHHVDPRTTSSYLAKLPAKMEMERQIHEFMEWLETLITLDIDDFPDKVGIDPAEYEKRKEQLLKSQFGGLICKDPLAGVQPGTTKGEVCGMFTKCITCNNRQNFFYTSVDNVIHTLLWNDAINQAYASGKIELTNEWASWAQFIKVIVVRLEKDKKHKAILQDALNAKEAIDFNPYMALFEGEVA